MKISILTQLKLAAPNLYRHTEKQIYYAIKKVDGRKKVHCLATADRKTAERKLVQWLGELQAGTPGAGTTPDMTVAQLLTAFAAARAGRARSTRTAETGFAKKMRELFDARGQGINLLVSRVRHSHLAGWLALLDADLRHSSYNRHRLFLMQLFEFAVAETIIDKSPLDPELISAKRKQRVIRRVPTEPEFRAIVEEIRHPHWPVKGQGRHGGQRPITQDGAGDFAEYLGLAGVGQAEAASLQWEDVDWERGVVSYTRRKTGRPFSHPIYAWLRPLLGRLFAASRKTGLVLAIKDVKKSLNAAKARLGYPNFTQRSLRAFLIGRLWKAGVDVKVIALWQGHSDGGKLIMDTYTEVFGSNDEDYQRQQLAKAEGKIVEFAAA